MKKLWLPLLLGLLLTAVLFPIGVSRSYSFRSCFNADHTHAVLDLPTRYWIEEVIKLFKGGSPGPKLGENEKD